MQISNKLNISKYFIGSLGNILLGLYFFAYSHVLVFFIFYFSVILNQYFLAIFVAELTGVDKNKTRIPTAFLGILKLLLLIFAFSYALIYAPGKELYFVLIYTFQLIILALSIKRVIKKIEGN